MSLKPPKFFSGNVFLWLDQLKIFHWQILTEFEPLTRWMEFEPLIQTMEFEPLTQPTDFDTLTQPTDFEPLTWPAEFSENGNGHVPDDPNPDPSSPDSSSNKKKRDKRKTSRKHRKDDSSESSSSNDSDMSDDSVYRRKKRKRKRYHKKYMIKLCAHLTAKFLTKAYKSKIIGFKIYEDMLQRRIYFLIFVKYLQMTFSQYTETWRVILYDPKIGGEDIED